MVGTVTCGLEWLITNFQTADMWMNCHAKHKEELDDRLSAIKAFQDNHIYHFNKKSVKRQSATISDFYESAVAHPDWVLKDVITILHPSLEFTKGYETIYIDSVTTK